MFLDEARLAARLNHPNVVHTFEVGEQKGVYFIAMEYLEGQSLHKIAKTAREAGVAVRPAIWARIVADALNGLHYAHELADYDGTPLHVIHRDVSPQNVFVTYGGAVKLVDFGIAKAVLNAAQTETGVLKGKVAYMAPEQALGEQMDRRADVFSMGVVFWELLAQKRLVTGDAPAALHKILNMEFPRLKDEVADVPPELDAIVMRAIERDPAKRFQTAQAMRVALESYLRKSGEFVEEDEVATLVTSLFKEHRAEVQQRISKYMSSRGQGSLPDLNVVSGTHSATSSSTGRSNREALPDDGSKASVVRTTGRPPARSRQRIVVAAAVLGAIAIASVAVFPRGSSTVKPAATPAATAPAPPASVQLTIHASPDNATLFLDDAMLPGNPFSGTFAKDGVEHHLRATAPSHVTETRNVWLNANATIELSLQPAPEPSAEGASSAAEAPASPHAGGGYRPPAAAPTQTPTPRTRPTLDTNVWGQ